MEKQKTLVGILHRWYQRSIDKKYPILSSIIIGTAIILFWRGIWGLADLYIFPNNQALSFSVSVLIGIVLLLLHDGRRRLKELE